MEHQNFMKSKFRTTIFTSRIKKQNIKEYLQKDLIQICFVMHKTLSKKHASVLFVKQMQILRIKNIRCKSLRILDKQLSDFIQSYDYFFSKCPISSVHGTMKTGNYHMNKFYLWLCVF